MKKVCQILKDTKGTTTLPYTIVLLIFMLLITLAVIINIQFRSLALEIYNTAEQCLSQYVTNQSEININSIKNGTNYVVELNEDEYIEYLALALGVDENLQGVTSNGRNFELTNIDITFYDENNIIDVKVNFDLLLEIEIMQITSTLEKNIEITYQLSTTY
ncbi:MAG: hypothetical protein R3Y35_13040 [Clostridia bacterium]